MMTKITFISDTHNKHNYLTSNAYNNILGSGDVLVHAGDISSMGRKYEIQNFLSWFANTNFKHKIFIAGNHDFGFEQKKEGITIPDNVIYLEDSEVVIDGIKIYGSPWQPEFFDWAFNLKRGEPLTEKWNMIPMDTNILVTHGPAFGMLDNTIQGLRVGCEDLVRRVFDVNPKIHVCGHIHYGYGMKKSLDVNFINASSLGERYTYDNKPIVIDYDEI